MRKFDTKIQHIKYKVLREVARNAWEDTLLEAMTELPETIIPGKEATMRCCVYKERAIIQKRMRLAMGGDRRNPNVVEVIRIACDECPVGGYEVSGACRGCITHRCMDVCPKDAIGIDRRQKAYIDKDKCVDCGRCASVCPYSAIINFKRPCENACKVSAVYMGENKCAEIDNEKCIACGACVYQCPFGAIQDKSFILNVIDLIQHSDYSKKFPVFAVVAPSISSQFSYAKLGQVVSGIKELGFAQVVEAALGADMVAYDEAAELGEKGFLTSSCCPAFVQYIKNQFPELAENISHNLSPMAAISKKIKIDHPGAKVVFIGPCTAKKMEIQQTAAAPFVDAVITFEELQALLDSRDIEITQLEATRLEDASYYGRIFARSGGLTDAVRQALAEQDMSEFDYRPVTCDGIDQCRSALLKAKSGRLQENFIEGMACVSGCIGGAGCLSHGPKNKMDVDKYGKQAVKRNITEAIGK